MLENMFIGRPPGNYDRLLDFSRAVTGNLFFAPSATFLEDAAEPQPGNSTEPAMDSSLRTRGSDGSLGIGSLKGESSNE
jgi:putative iron-dependent peroxidase